MGCLIAFEGTDGSGKHTQSELLYQAMREKKIPSKLLSFPRYDNTSSSLIKMYLNGEFGSKPEDVNAFAASTFYAVDRYASFQNDWKGLYEQERSVIITDRYTTSNAIHQGSKMPVEKRDYYLSWLWDFEYEKLGLPRPDMVFFLDVPVEITAELRRRRAAENGTALDIHERDEAYLQHCRKTALQIAARNRWNVVDCVEDGKLLPVDAIHQKIMRLFDNWYDFSHAYIYETGEESTNILGSGSDFYNVVQTSDKEKAFEAFAHGRRNYLRRYHVNLDGRRVTEYWDAESNSWKD